MSPSTTPTDSSPPPDSSFLQQLKDQYKMIFDIKTSLENKANNIISISGTVAALLFGFGIFLIDKLGPTYQLTSYVSFILIVSIGGSVLAILLSIWSFKIQPYSYVFQPKIFFNTDGTHTDQVAAYKNAKWDKFKDMTINDILNVTD